MSFWSAMGKLFPRDKVSVYVAMGDLSYTRVAGKLENAGIPFYVRTRGMMGNQVAGQDNRLSEYEIYVKREYEEEARYVLGTS